MTKFNSWYQKGKNKEKHTEKNKIWRAKNKQRIKIKNAHYRSTARGRAIALMSGVRARSAKKSLPYDIDAAWIEEKISSGFCPMTGLKFDLVNPRGPKSPSLDRIKSNMGYTKNNTQVVCFIYNICKGEFTHEDVLQFCNSVLERDSLNRMR